MINTVTSILPPVHGGRTKALLSRIRLLDQHLGIQNKIYTTNYNANYLEVYHQFREEGTVTPSTTFENMYDWLSGFKLLNIPTTKFRKKIIYHETNRDIEGLTYKVSDDGNVVRYYNEKRMFYIENIMKTQILCNLKMSCLQFLKRKLNAESLINMDRCIGKHFIHDKHFVK